MDIRVAAYRPVTVQSFNSSRGSLVAVTDSSRNGPVPPVSPISANRPQLAELATQLRQANMGGGYTDATRGSNINILA